MKIEIGESLVRSWLRHVEHCEFAELNWKPSPTWQAPDNIQAKTVFENALAEWPEAFGKNTFSQFLKQAEIDVLGLNITNNKLHLVDIAFHSGGLNYGAQGKTGQRIFKKLSRSALIAQTYFPGREAIVYFVTPVCTPGIKKEVEAAYARACAVISSIPDISFQLIIGSDFKTQIVDEVLALGSDVADTSELFLRSWQLIQPFLNVAEVRPTTGNDIDTTNTQVAVRGVDRRPMYIAALYMSRFGHHELNQGNQTQAFAYLGNRYGVAPNTVKNIRDRFDRYVDNHRVGWNAPLPENLQAVLDEFDGDDEPELRANL